MDNEYYGVLVTVCIRKETAMLNIFTDNWDNPPILKVAD